MIKSIEQYKNQHKIILSVCEALNSAAQYGVSEKDFSSYLDILSTLDNILLAHLDSEDTYLYPRLMEDENATIQEIAHTLQKEMFPITDVYKKYKEKYKIEENILVEVETFLVDTKSIVFALKTRIKKEENNLYTLL